METESGQIDYDGRRFRSVENSASGDVDAATVFVYRQTGAVVWGTYEGGAIRFGTLLATVEDDASLRMHYQHFTVTGEFKAGACVSRPERLADGRLRLHETWRWTEGGRGSGTSVVEEIAVVPHRAARR